MIIALFDKPNDRDFIINLENILINLINSSDPSYQLTPMNSYYRLLTHQVAQYHNLAHVANDTRLVIYKDDSFQFDDKKPLLQALKQSDYKKKSTVSTPTTKYKILKRKNNPASESSESLESTSSASVIPGSSKSVSELDMEKQRIERERLYEQKKLEIFEKLNSEFEDGDDDREEEKLSNQTRNGVSYLRNNSQYHDYNSRQRQYLPPYPYSQTMTSNPYLNNPQIMYQQAYPIAIPPLAQQYQQQQCFQGSYPYQPYQYPYQYAMTAPATTPQLNSKIPYSQNTMATNFNNKKRYKEK